MRTRPHTGVVIERGERDPVLRHRRRAKLGGQRPLVEFVDDRRPADAAETAKATRGRFVEGHQFFTPNPCEIHPAHAGTAAERRAVLLAAFRAMAVAWRAEPASYLELDAAAQAAAADRGHLRASPWPSLPLAEPPLGTFGAKALSHSMT